MSKPMMLLLALVAISQSALAQDVFVSSIEPAGDTASESVTVYVGNNGPVDAFDVPVSLDVRNPLGVTVSAQAIIPVVPANVSPQSQGFVFTGPFDLSGAGSYEFTATVSLPGDTNVVNDQAVNASPVTMPYFQDFESVPLKLPIESTGLIPAANGFGVTRLDVAGRSAIRIWGLNGNDDNQVLAFDNPGGGGVNRATLYLETASFDVDVSPDIFLGFLWYDHGDEGDALDRVEIRTDPSDPWLEVYDFALNTNNGAWTTATGINLSAAVRNYEPPDPMDPLLSFGSTLEIRFSQTDNFPINTDGISIDEVELRFGPVDDVGVTAIALDAADNPFSLSTSLEVEVQNFTDFQQTNVPVEISITGPDGSLNTFNSTVPTLPAATYLDRDDPYGGVDTAEPGTETITVAVTFPAFGDSLVSAKTSLANDENSTNDEVVESYLRTSTAALPVFEGFENAGPTSSYTGVAADLEGLTGWQYDPSLVNERLQLRQTAIGAFSGSAAATLDGGNFGQNRLYLTVDASALRAADDPLVFRSWYYDVGDEDGALDQFFVQGQASDSAQAFFDWNDGSTFAWLFSGTHELSRVLRSGAQEFSATTRVKFQQSDNFNIATDGLIVDEVQLFQPVRGLIIEQFFEDQTITAGVNAETYATQQSPLSLGGERDARVSAGATDPAEAQLLAGLLTTDQIGGEVAFSWDGIDGDATMLNPAGLAGVDLTNGGIDDGLLFELDSDWTFDLVVHTDAGNASSLSATSGGSSATGASLFVPFADLAATAGVGADLSSVGAIELVLNGNTSLAWIETAASATAEMSAHLTADVGNDGAINQFDSVRLIAEIRTPIGSPDMQAVTFAVDVDPATVLQYQTLTSSAGTIVSGNAPGDERIEVDFELNGGASEQVMFDVLVTADPGTALSASFQGEISTPTLTRFSDDPFDPASRQDPTVFEIVSSNGMVSLSDSVITDNGDGVDGPGDIIEYTATITNNGDGPLGSAVLEAGPFDNASLVNMSVTTSQGTVTSGNGGQPEVGVNLGTIAVGTPVTISWQSTVDAVLPDGLDALSVQAVLTTPGAGDFLSDDPDTAAMNDATLTTMTAAPDLALTLFDARDAVSPGEIYNTSLILDNNGNQDAAGVLLSLTIPEGTGFSDAATTAAWDCVPDDAPGSVCTLGVGALAAANSTVADFVVEVGAPPDALPAQIVLTASVSDNGANGAENTSDNTASDINDLVATDLAVALSPGSQQRMSGEAFSVTVTVSNLSTLDSGQLDYQLLLPAGIVVTGPLNWTCQLADLSGASLCTVTTPELLAGGQVNGQIDLEVVAGSAPVANGEIVLTVIPATSDRDTSNNSSTALVSFGELLEVDLSIIKTVSVEELNAMDRAVEYTLVVSSDTDIVGARVIDMMPAELSATSWTCSAVGLSSCPAGGNGDIDVLVDLSPGAPVTFIIEASVRVTADSRTISNTASVGVPMGTVDSNPANDSDTAAFTVTGSDVVFADRFEVVQ